MPKNENRLNRIDEELKTMKTPPPNSNSRQQNASKQL